MDAETVMSTVRDGGEIQATDVSEDDARKLERLKRKAEKKLRKKDKSDYQQ